jgi:hypothetical protein
MRGGFIMIRRFDSLSEFLQIAKEHGSKSYGMWRNQSNGNHWDGGISSAKALELAENGSLDMVSSADMFLHQLETNIENAPIVSYVPSVYGSRVSVPAYLSGVPNCMRRRVIKEGSARQVSIYVSLTSSGGISAGTLLKRGMTILALLRSLQACRVSVDLFLMTELDGNRDKTGETILIIPIESKPLDLSVASFVIAHPAFDRNLTHPVCSYLNGYDGGWSIHNSNNGGAERFRKYLKLESKDVLIPSAHLYDSIITRPDEWLRERISQITNMEE